jgi:hypothetical protein
MPIAVAVGGYVERIAQKDREILAALQQFKASSPEAARS